MIAFIRVYFIRLWKSFSILCLLAYCLLLYFLGLTAYIIILELFYNIVDFSVGESYSHLSSFLESFWIF